MKSFKQYISEMPNLLGMSKAISKRLNTSGYSMVSNNNNMNIFSKSEDNKTHYIVHSPKNGHVTFTIDNNNVVSAINKTPRFKNVAEVYKDIIKNIHREKRMKTFKQFLKELFTQEEKDAIENYTDQPHYSNKKIINRLAERERTKQNLVLHLGMNPEKAEELGIHKPVKKQTTVKLKDLQSASKDSKIASRFGNIRVVLEHPKGSKGLNIPHELSSRIVPEHEVILPKGHRMIIHRSETDNKGGITHYGRTINDESNKK